MVIYQLMVVGVTDQPCQNVLILVVEVSSIVYTGLAAQGRRWEEVRMD